MHTHTCGGGGGGVPTCISQQPKAEEGQEFQGSLGYIMRTSGVAGQERQIQGSYGNNSQSRRDLRDGPIQES